MTEEFSIYDSDLCESQPLLEQDDNVNCIEEEVVTIYNLSDVFDYDDMDKSSTGKYLTKLIM